MIPEEETACAELNMSTTAARRNFGQIYRDYAAHQLGWYAALELASKVAAS